eukprot:TRINITY_DN10826_c0_g1_i5.p1 TRINITY_DN10826_c0_g1~~TRINITY_DN10826_c0_g1_i5.p1  ORF type:complete len:714 (+),score=101.96 TRINITY_DN10826_c0_g1_i5:152-2143(+)
MARCWAFQAHVWNEQDESDLGLEGYIWHQLQGYRLTTMPKAKVPLALTIKVTLTHPDEDTDATDQGLMQYLTGKYIMQRGTIRNVEFLARLGLRHPFKLEVTESSDDGSPASDSIARVNEQTRVDVLVHKSDHVSSQGSFVGLEQPLRQVEAWIRMPLEHQTQLGKLGLSLNVGVLLCGPPGCGKTLLVKTLAARCNLRLMVIEPSAVFGSYMGESEANLRRLFAKAAALAHHEPCLLFFDELDALCPKRSDSSSTESRLVAQMLTLLDGLSSRGQLIILAATNRPNALDPALRRPGRLDKEIVMPPLQEEERLAILQHHTAGMALEPQVQLPIIAYKTQGYVGADLAAVCREAGMLALRADAVAITQSHFEAAVKAVVPSGNRRDQVTVTAVTWDSIGGLDDVKHKLQQAAEWPLKHRDVFARFNLKPPRGILMYGPPGCSKTTMARAIATSCQATFLTLNGAQIFSPYVGDSEAEIRRIFQRARAAAPSILFLDEVDALVGKRSSSGRSVAARVLSTLLNEMDGIESAGHVLVLAATNRPDQLDAAFLRPGRIDRSVFIPPPDLLGRQKIFQAVTSSMPVDPDVDFESLARQTEGYTGADIKSLCHEAAMTTLRQAPEEQTSGYVVQSKHFQDALLRVGASLTTEQLEYYSNLKPDSAGVI